MWPGTRVTSTEILVMLFFTSGDTTKISGDETNVPGKLTLEKTTFLRFGLLPIEDFPHLHDKLNVFKCGINHQ